MNQSMIAVIDIGKTNKKVLIYDNNLKPVATRRKGFEEKIIDGVHYEPLEEIVEWLIFTIKELAIDHDIGALSITTHGATAFCVGEDGKLSTPPVAYTTESPQKMSDDFFDLCGDRNDLQVETATAEIGSMINVAKLIHFIKQTWPAEFAATKHILNYPQYLGYIFTGKTGADTTYMGCHSYLFNPNTRSYSSVADKLGITKMLPDNVVNSWDVLGMVSSKMSEKTGLRTDCIVTMGIHDSNSSLLPYLVKQQEEFVLNSTGTWCVAMHPAKDFNFAPDEIGKTVFYNIDAFYHPVKTGIFMGGLEYGAYTDLLKEIHGEFDSNAYDPEVYQKALSEKRCFILPSVVAGVGIFPESSPRVVESGTVYSLDDVKSGKIPPFFKDPAYAMAVLNLSLALQTKVAFGFIGFAGKGKLYTEGGFRMNAAYVSLLAALYPAAKVACTHMEEATATGAAILAKAALENSDPMVAKDLLTIDEIPVETPSYTGFDAYEAEYLSLLKS